MAWLADRKIIPVHQLRWKLTLSYTAVTVGVLLVIELIVIASVFAYFISNARLSPEGVLQELNSGWVPLAQPYLSEDPPDIEGLQNFLQQFLGSQVDTDPLVITGSLELELKSYNFLNVIFVDADGNPVGAIPHDVLDDSGEASLSVLNSVAGLEDHLRLALEGERDTFRLYSVQEPDNSVVGAIPIYHKNDASKVVGALVFTTKSIPWGLLPIKEIVRQFGYSFLIITLAVGLLGTAFGSITARSLVKRLHNLSDSARAWSQGDFSISVDDGAEDELGLLAQDLNSMAGQLEDLLNKREEMSVIEERSRLARDLHDSVKQQAFAASAQLGAAIARLKNDPTSAEMHVVEAERLVYEVRQELTDLIRELHPVALKDSSLAPAIREYASDWAAQKDIEIEVQVDGERPLSVEVEQALFRIAQEALANIARHSQAKRVGICLCYQKSEVLLKIEDDGVGFEPLSAHGGLGLRSMRERCELLGGEITIESAPGNGTRIQARCVI